jgi:hypothetical protein
VLREENKKTSVANLLDMTWFNIITSFFFCLYVSVRIVLQTKTYTKIHEEQCLSPLSRLRNKKKKKRNYQHLISQKAEYDFTTGIEADNSRG